MKFIESLKPKNAFWFGILIGVEVVTLIGLAGTSAFIMVKAELPSQNAAADIAALAGDETPDINGAVDMAALTHIRGTGDITIVEYSDTECPFCKRFHETLKEIIPEFEGKVRWGYKQFPLESLHAKARRESNATECAAEQNKFWEYTDQIFEQTGSNDSLPDEALYSIADSLSLDRGQFDACLEAQTYNDKIQADIDEATALGGTGTPYSLIVDNDGNVLDVINGAQEPATVRAQLQDLI